jgi:hypothetical protein
VRYMPMGRRILTFGVGAGRLQIKRHDPAGGCKPCAGAILAAVLVVKVVVSGTDRTLQGNGLNTTMRTFTSSVLFAALILALANLSMAQSGIRFASTAAISQPKSSNRQANPQLTSQIVTNEGTADAGAAASGGYVPAEASATIGAGCAYGGMGAYGYNPDFGYGPGGMSVWPGVPACCDPWFGYCGEPRCFYTCNCHQGTYQVFHCPKCNNGQCGPELLKWQKGDWSANCWKPSAMCYGSKCNTCTARCARCRSASYESSAVSAPCCNSRPDGTDQEPRASDGPAVTPAPEIQSQPPRNALPTTGPSPSARRTTIRPTA